MIPASDEHVQTLVGRARTRIVAASSTAPDFTAANAEVIVFDVAGHREDADRAAAAVRGLGDDAVATAKRSLAQRYGGRNPEKGWIGVVMILAAIAAALTPAFAAGLRGGDAATYTTVTSGLAVAAAVCQLIALAGSRLRPMNRFVLRLQILICGALAVGVAISFGNGMLVPAIVQSVAAAVALAVFVAIIAIRARDGDATTEIDLSVERAYLDAIAEVEGGARRAQTELDAAVDPTDAALIVRVRNAVFGELGTQIPTLVGVDPLTPAGGVIVATHADPDRWLPPAMAKSRLRTA